MHELEADTATVWKERHELLDDIDRMASRLHEAASSAAARFTEDEQGEAEDEAHEDVREEAQGEVVDEAETEPEQPTEVEQTAVLPAAAAGGDQKRRARKS